ncbi:MAG: DUF58 domain-containing protein [Planctomycetota bacterium]
MQTSEEPLFGPEFARRLERLKWILRKRIAGGGEGEKAGRKKGGLIEFADHRDYAPGDDLRYIDWHAYARLDRLAVKEFSKEEEVPLRLLLDVSASMAAGDPRKFHLALQAALGLGFIALTSHNPVTVAAFRREEQSVSHTFRGADALFEMGAFLEGLRAQGRTDLEGALREAGAASPPQGLVVLISDLMTAPAFRQSLSALATKGREVCVLQVLSPSETAPELTGPVALRDAETGETLELDLAPGDLETFRRGQSDEEERFRRFASARSIRFVAVRSDTPFEEVVLDTLRQANWLRFGK